ncbi:unnamed protein product [Lymnaea stagnalis]|uniref:LRRCT domain-containing protein n=1 Tax=Lymnaea stagnalis TaxID=6523 RepID=A0AAV2HEB6_LYMST
MNVKGHLSPFPQSVTSLSTQQADTRMAGLMPTLVVYLTTLAVLVPAQTTCPPRCRSCTNNEVKCNNRSLTAPPRSYPTGTTTINLADNHIRVLGARAFTRADTVEVLKLSGNKLAGLRNDAFSYFPNLMSLDLSDNRISGMHRKALRNMKQLRTLSISKNKLSTLDFLEETPNLFQLDLGYNKIRTIGENDLAALTRIHNLDLRGNTIVTIHARAFKSLRYLRSLSLNNNPMSTMPRLEFTTEFLQLVDLSSCNLSAVPGPFPASVSDLRLGQNAIQQVLHTDLLNITDLELLTLNDNQIRFFADGALSHLTMLTEVWLRSNNLVYIPRDLPNSLTKIHMDSNKIAEIESGIFSNQSRLVYLTVENNIITRIQPDTFKGLRFLDTLNFQGNNIHTLEAGTFSDLGSLSTIFLSNNLLRRIEIGAFHNLGNLSRLFLSYQPTEEFELMGSFLPEMLRLQELHMMGSHGLVDAFMAIINDPEIALVPMSSLTLLDVSYNNLQWITPRVRVIFPNLASFILNGNPLRCSRNLKWLRDWMVSSDVKFHDNEEVTCESPLRLRGRTVRSIQDAEWAEIGEVDIGESISAPQNDPSEAAPQVQPQPQRGTEGKKSKEEKVKKEKSERGKKKDKTNNKRNGKKEKPGKDGQSAEEQKKRKNKDNGEKEKERKNKKAKSGKKDSPKDKSIN